MPGYKVFLKFSIRNQAEKYSIGSGGRYATQYPYIPIHDKWMFFNIILNSFYTKSSLIICAITHFSAIFNCIDKR